MLRENIRVQIIQYQTNNKFPSHTDEGRQIAKDRSLLPSTWSQTKSRWSRDGVRTGHKEGFKRSQNLMDVDSEASN